jgi:hypothetical protein
MEKNRQHQAHAMTIIINSEMHRAKKTKVTLRIHLTMFVNIGIVSSGDLSSGKEVRVRSRSQLINLEKAIDHRRRLKSVSVYVFQSLIIVRT